MNDMFELDSLVEKVKPAEKAVE